MSFAVSMISLDIMDIIYYYLVWCVLFVAFGEQIYH